MSAYRLAEARGKDRDPVARRLPLVKSIVVMGGAGLWLAGNFRDDDALLREALDLEERGRVGRSSDARAGSRIAQTAASMLESAMRALAITMPNLADLRQTNTWACDG